MRDKTALTSFASFASSAAVLALVSLVSCGPSAGPAKSGTASTLTPQRIGAPPGVSIVSACTPSGPELCFNAADDNCNGIIDEGCGLHTGLVQFAIAWDEPRADVDLRVFDPSGELVEVGRPARSGLVKERDCPGRNN